MSIYLKFTTIWQLLSLFICPQMAESIINNITPVNSLRTRGAHSIYCIRIWQLKIIHYQGRGRTEWARRNDNFRVPQQHCAFSSFFFLLCVPSVLWRCWLGGRKGIRPVKTWVVGCWHGYLSGARCWLAYGPADATATHCLLLQWNPDWYCLSGTGSPG